MAVDLTTPVLAEFLTLVKAGLTLPPARAFVAAGAVAWDDCCDGQTWVRATEVNPDPRPPQACAVHHWDVGVEAGVLRCAEVVNDQGQAPSPARLTAEAARVSRDMWDLAEVLRCYWSLVPGVVRVDLGAWTPAGPEGGCVGGTWQTIVRLGACACPGEESVSGPRPLGLSQ